MRGGRRVSAVLLPLAWLLGCVFFSSPCQAGNLLTVEELQHGIERRIHTVPEFKKIRDFANQRGLRVFLVGNVATSLAYAVKHELQLDSKIFENYSSSDHTDLYRILSFSQQAIVVVNGHRGEAYELFATLESAPFPYRLPDGLFWKVLSDEEYRTSHSLEPLADSFSVGRIELSGPSRESSVPVAQRAFLQDILKNTNPYVRLPNPQTGLRIQDRWYLTLRYLGNLARYQLNLPADEALRIKDLVRQLRESSFSVDLDLAYSLLYDAYDLPETLKTLEALGVLEVFYRQGIPNEAEPFYYFVQKIKRLGVHSFNPARYERFWSSELDRIPNHSIIEGTLQYSGARPHFFVDYDAGEFPHYREAVRQMQKDMKDEPIYDRLRRLQLFSIQASRSGRQPGFWLAPGSVTGKYDCRDQALLFHLFANEAGYPNYFFSTRPHTYNVVVEKERHYRLDPTFVDFWPPVESDKAETARYDFRVWVPAPEKSSFHDRPMVESKPCRVLLSRIPSEV